MEKIKRLIYLYRHNRGRDRHKYKCGCSNVWYVSEQKPDHCEWCKSESIEYLYQTPIKALKKSWEYAITRPAKEKKILAAHHKAQQEISKLNKTWQT